MTIKGRRLGCPQNSRGHLVKWKAGQDLAPNTVETPLNLRLLATWAPPLSLFAATLLFAGSVAAIADIDPSKLFVPYLSASFGTTAVLASLLYVFVEVVRLAPKGAERPLRIVVGRIWDRAPLLVLPWLLFPIFLIAFTTAKSGIPFLVGYEWEAFWADADSAVFGADVWRLASAITPAWAYNFYELAYTAGWGIISYFAVAFITLYSPPKRVMIFFTAAFATWLLGGVLMAYSVSAAGPVYAHLADPALQARFAPLHEFLFASFPENGPIRATQEYLLFEHMAHQAVKGGGISAMPSMHIGMVTLLLLAVWQSWLRIPAAMFWVIIFVGSGLFGYHYWLDGVAGAGIACAAWWSASRYYNSLIGRVGKPVESTRPELRSV